jgi:heme-degrading monooxygenase HmoA
MICVTTRFELKYPWQLLSMYLSYRRMLPTLKITPGLIRYAFLVQSPLVCYTLSIWESKDAIISFSNVPAHIKALRSAKGSCRGIWSAYWQLAAVSQFANQWEGSAPWPQLTGRILPPHRIVQKLL